MSKQTVLLIGGITLVTILIIFLAGSARKPSPETPQTTGPTPTETTTQTQSSQIADVAETTLKLSPNPLQLTSDSGTLNAEITTGKNDVTAAQLELTYDPNVIAVDDIKPATFLAKATPLFKKIDNDKGRATYMVGIQPTQTGERGAGTLATISFRVKNRTANQTEISLEKSIVTAEGIVLSVLKQATGATIILK